MVGTPPSVHAITEEYLERQGKRTRSDEILEDDTNRLLYALLVEARVSRFRETGNTLPIWEVLNRFDGEGAGAVAEGRHTMTPGSMVYLQNEQWDNGSISTISFSGDLAAGDTETVVEWISEDSPILAGAVGVTSHTADLDSDSIDKSVVEYRYQYREEGSGRWKTLEHPTGITPIGDLSRPQPLAPETWIGPMQDFRVRFHNRTDDSAFTDTTVPAEEIGCVLMGEVVG